ncbi:hypothetical protein JXB02_01600 [Candidatus Woesearchaeota archaeon]|nr:hypothetical protein [Candidatus Woesearchaeota archaeon]
MDNTKKTMILIIVLAAIVGLFYALKGVDPAAMEGLGSGMPLPLFTFAIAIIDGFNPCTLFILTLLLGLLMSVSHSRRRILIIGLSFVVMVYLIYFLFMAAWLNIFRYIGFIDPLRYTIAALAILAGLINIKELIWFRKGITLMIQEKHKAPLMARIGHMKEVIRKGSLPALIGSSIFLAAFSSLVELPCTAGFPIIYTSILAGKGLGAGLGHYAYLAFYNLVYVLPLSAVILVFGWTFRSREITKDQMAWIKFVGGAIMLVLGILLLTNPALIMGS